MNNVFKIETILNIRVEKACIYLLFSLVNNKLLISISFIYSKLTTYFFCLIYTYNTDTFVVITLYIVHIFTITDVKRYMLTHLRNMIAGTKCHRVTPKIVKPIPELSLTTLSWLFLICSKNITFPKSMILYIRLYQTHDNYTNNNTSLIINNQ